MIMDTIKRLAIRYGTPRIAETNTTRRISISFRDAKKIGVLVDLSNRAELMMQHEAIRVFKKYNKDVVVLGMYRRAPKDLERQYLTFHLGDISLTGRVRSKTIHRFANQEFAFLYCLTNSKHPIFERIMAMSQAHCRIGPYRKGGEGCFDMMVQLDQGQDISQLFKKMMHLSYALG